MEGSNEYNSDSDSENGDFGGDVSSVKFTKTSFLLVVLDTVENMFVVGGDDKLSPFQMTIRSCLSIAERLLLTLKENSKIAVIMNGNPNLTTFKTSASDLVKLLLDMNGQSNEELKKRYMSKSAMNVADMLLKGKRLYKDVKSPGIKNLIFLTNDDCPTGKNDKAKDAAKHEAQNIGKNIVLDIVTFTSDFEFEEFYGDILKAAKRPVLYEFCPNLELLENKLGFYCIYIHHESTIKFYPLDDFETKISMIKSRSIRRNRDILTNAKLTLDHSAEVTRVVERNVTNEYYLESKKSLILSAAERDELLTHNIPTGLHLVSMASPTEWIAPASITDILYCRELEDQVKIEPFWDHCRETGDVLVCVVMKQRNKLGRHCELHAINVDQSKCFLIHTLTYTHDRYKDDHLDLYGTSTVAKEPTDVETKAAEDLINAMTIDYDRDTFRCPAATKYREYFRSQLLDVPLRDLKDIDVRTRQYASDEGAVRTAAATFKSLLIDPYAAPKAKATKRAPAASKAAAKSETRSAPKKRSKKEEPPIMHVQ